MSQLPIKSNPLIHKQHGQQLQYICLSPTCLPKGLICRGCINIAHMGHTVISIHQLAADYDQCARNNPIQASLRECLQRFKNTTSNLSRDIERMRNQITITLDELEGQFHIESKAAQQEIVGWIERVNQITLRPTNGAMMEQLNTNTITKAQQLIRYHTVSREAEQAKQQIEAAIQQKAQLVVHACQSCEKHLAEALRNIDTLSLPRKFQFGERKVEYTNRTIGFSEIDKLPAITELAIKDCKSSEWEKIGERLGGFSSLTKLQVQDCAFSRLFCESIAKSRSIIELNISCNPFGRNQIGSEGARALVQGLKQLVKLNIGMLYGNAAGNNIEAGGASAIALGLHSLTLLDIGNNNIRKEGAQAIALLKQLTILQLWNNDIGDDGAVAIATSLKQLKELRMSGNDIGDIGAKAVAEGLLQLTVLDISNSASSEYKVSEAGARAIADWLTQLTELRLKNNIVGDAGADAIAHRLTNLAILDIEYNDVSGKCKWAILDLINNRNPKALVEI